MVQVNGRIGPRWGKKGGGANNGGRGRDRRRGRSSRPPGWCGAPPGGRARCPACTWGAGAGRRGGQRTSGAAVCWGVFAGSLFMTLGFGPDFEAVGCLHIRQSPQPPPSPLPPTNSQLSRARVGVGHAAPGAWGTLSLGGVQEAHGRVVPLDEHVARGWAPDAGVSPRDLGVYCRGPSQTDLPPPESSEPEAPHNHRRGRLERITKAPPPHVQTFNAPVSPFHQSWAFGDYSCLRRRTFTLSQGLSAIAFSIGGNLN